MLKNIDYSLINKANVSFSLYIIPLTFIGVLILVLTGIHFNEFSENMYEPSFSLLEVITGTIYVMVMGAIIWGPMLILMFILEQLCIRKNSTEKTVVGLFIIEIVIVAISLPIILTGFYPYILLYIIAALSLAQVLRWWRLKAKEHLYNSAPSNKSNDY
jgi:hypothetical protein